MTRRGPGKRESGYSAGEGLTSQSFEEIREIFLADHGALGIQLAVITQALESAKTVFLRFNKKQKIEEILLNLVLIKTLTDVAGVDPKKEDAYNIYSQYVMLEQQVNNLKLSFVQNKTIRINANILLGQLSQLQTQYSALAGDYKPNRIPRQLRKYSR